MIRLAKQYGWYGYRKVTALLRMEGWRVNHKRIERLWNEEGLQLPRRHKKRKRLYHKDSSIIRLRPTHPNHIWAIDFVHDKLSNGHSYKMFTVLDEYTREALCVAVRPKMNANDVLETLHPLLIKHGKPEFIRSDNGPEFIATHLQDWLKKVGIKPMQIYPGSPWECGGIRKQCGTLFSRHMIQRTLQRHLAKRSPQRRMVSHHQTSSGRNQCLAQAIQSDQTSSCPKHETTRP